ncbi:unnamed protein product [Schistosoma curassoni]|uniref:BRCT domain-containing protein n=1 Tax=Schistosoma curassoni TaxID=6186 RepID=A0A183KAR7_9TREM|nr:unnamed protein product [Schistosoma curassoni]
MQVSIASTALSLNIHNWKGEILRYNPECTNAITIDGDSEKLKTFTYLNSFIEEHGGSDSNVNAVLLYGGKPGELRKSSSRRYKCLLTDIYAKYLEPIGQILSATAY